MDPLHDLLGTKRLFSQLSEKGRQTLPIQAEQGGFI
jgi:hypothetical protein